MNDLTAPLSPQQTSLLITMAQQYLMEGAWPVWRFTVATLDRYDFDAEELVRSLPRVGSTGHVGPSYGLTSHIGHQIADDDRPALTIAASLHLSELQPYIGEPFLRTLHTLVALQRNAPVSTQDAMKPRYTLADIAGALPGLPEGFLARLPDILRLEPATWVGSSGTTEEGIWWHELDRELRKYREATDLEQYVHTTSRLITAMAKELSVPAQTAPAPIPVPARGSYVDDGLIADLEAKDTALRVDKLVALARELNTNHAAENPYACQMLLRAILDHVPPAFGQSAFQGVVASFPWGRTDKVYVKKLSEFRNSADDVLHRQISTQPSRIDMHDLPPRACVNALLQGVLVHLPGIPQPQGSQ
ncbi:hypothetical protein ACFWSF_35250 [Streptomyces sp. NPDC058611]|uniref:hypothetical protein n=1 Tax=unclassified Streptomyces TaxID=2593676 RepID=UPI003661D833